MTATHPTEKIVQKFKIIYKVYDKLITADDLCDTDLRKANGIQSD